MTIKVRKANDKGMFRAIADQLNQLREASVGSNFHASTTAVSQTGDPPVYTALAVTAANGAGTVPLIVALANNIKAVLNLHYADMDAHKSVQTAAIATADATDLATAQTLLNACKTSYNTGGHLNTANVHFNNDGTNTIAAVNATDQASADTLGNELKTDINAHILGALAGQHISLIDS